MQNRLHFKYIDMHMTHFKIQLNFIYGLALEKLRKINDVRVLFMFTQNCKVSALWHLNVSFPFLVNGKKAPISFRGPA
jgi:hypothetical protein